MKKGGYKQLVEGFGSTLDMYIDISRLILLEKTSIKSMLTKIYKQKEVNRL